jgi:hypothetical protein
MYLRTKFVTNSSSTSVIGWGVYLNREEFNKLGDFPKGIDYACPPSGDYLVYIELPNIRLDDDGMMVFPKADSCKEAYKGLKELLEAAGITEKPGYVEESWYDG